MSDVITTEAFRLGTLAMRNEIESLRQQLSAALTACKVKDAALQSAISAHKYESGDLHDALAIQPDDRALKAWLGEPTAYLFQHEDTGRTMCVETQQLEWNFEKNNPRLFNCGPLYSPKLLK